MTQQLIDLKNKKIIILFILLILFFFSLLLITIKDEIFDKFVKSGDLGSTGYEKVEIKKNKYDLYLSLMWILLILPITLVYLIKALWFGSLYFRLAIFITIYSS